MSLLTQLAQKIVNKRSAEKSTPQIDHTALKPHEAPQPKIQNPEPPVDPSETSLLNTIISSLRDGVILLDKSGQTLAVNSIAEEITGFAKNELLKKQLTKLVTLKDPAGQIIQVEKITAATSPQKIDLTGKDEHKANIEITIIPTDDPNIGFMLLLHDLTQEKVFEQMQIDFVSMASHEFRTPLTSIIDYLSVLEEESGKSLAKEQKEFLDRALQSAQQLSALVNNILNVAKVERGSFAVSLKPLNLNKILKEALENNQGHALQKSIFLTLDLPSHPLPEALADEVRINEVLNNLLDNAINYTKNQGKIEIGAKTNNNEVVIHIKDNGIGIPKEALGHLFTKFFRGSEALKDDYKSNGLGLYLSKSIIDLHHGRIWVESAVGKGSTFFFSLPIAGKSKTIADLH